MATGDPVVQILRVLPPGSSFAGPIEKAGGSTPAETFRGFAFDAASDEYMDFLCVLEGYDGGGLTIKLKWESEDQTSGNVVWGAAIRRIADDAEDTDTSHSYSFNTVTAAAPSAVGEWSYDNITFSDGADMDSLADGEAFVLRIQRDADNGSDTMSNDAYLWGVNGVET